MRSSVLHGTLLSLAFLAGSSLAGDLNNWTTIPVPPNITGSVNVIGTTASFQTTTDVRLYSGVTKKWTTLPIVTGIAFFEQYNDYVVIQDGNSIHGWASVTDVVDTLTVSANAVIKSGPVSSSWVTLVVDGTQAWGFSGFRGVWVPLTLSQPNPTLAANRLLGLVKDGTAVYAFSAHWGTFVPIAADAGAVLAISGEGEAGTAHTPGSFFRGFSAEQNTWSAMPLGPTSVSILKSDYALATSGTTVVGYSGLSGTLATYTSQATVTSVTADEGVAGFIDGANVVCYGSGPGNFARIAATPIALQADNDFLMVAETGKVTPFSAITGTFGPTLNGAFVVNTNDEVAFADGPGTDFAYSSILNQWFAAPAVTPIGSAILVRSSVVIAHALGYEALSARYGTWVSLQTGLPDTFLAPATGSTFVAFDGSMDIASVFDTRLNRFETIIGNAPLAVKISRHTAMAHDGVTGFGFGQPTGRFDQVALQSPIVSFDCASSIGCIRTNTDIHVYSVLGSFSYEGRFPEFTRAIDLGNTLRLHQTGPAGSSLILFIGTAPAHIDLGLLLGWFDIDPTVLLTLALPQTIPANGRLDFDIALPPSPALVGFEPHLQNAVIPPSAPPYMSTSVAPVLY